MPFGCCLPGSSRAALDHPDDHLPPVRKLVVDRGRVITAPVTPKRASVRMPRWPISRYSSAYKDRRVLKTGVDRPLEETDEKAEADYLTFKALEIDTDSTPSLEALNSPVSADYEIPPTTTRTKHVAIAHPRRVSRMAIHDQYWSQPDGDLFGHPYARGHNVTKIRLQPRLQEPKPSPSPPTSTVPNALADPSPSDLSGAVPTTRRSLESHGSVTTAMSTAQPLLQPSTIRKPSSTEGSRRISNSDPARRSPSRSSSHRGSSTERHTLAARSSTTTAATSTTTIGSAIRVRAASSSRVEVRSSALQSDAPGVQRDPLLRYSRSLTAVHIRTPSESLAPPAALQPLQQPRTRGPTPPPKALSRVGPRTPSVALRSQVGVAVAVGVGRRGSGREVGIVPVGRRKTSGEERRVNGLAERRVSGAGEKMMGHGEARSMGDRRASIRRSMRASVDGEKVVGMRDRGRLPAAVAAAACDKALPPSPKLVAVGA